MHNIAAEKLKSRYGPRAINYMCRAGLPWPVINRTYGSVAAAVQPFEVLRRRRQGAALSKSPYYDLVPGNAGYRLLGKEELPGIQDVTRRASKIAKARIKSGNLTKKENNPFYPILENQQFSDHPEIAEFSLSEPVLAAVTGYFGSVPQMSYMGLWLTRANEKANLFNSQLAHLDKPEVQILTLFINLSDVGSENGPFTFFPADVSRRICSVLGYQQRYFTGADKSEASGRIDDATIGRLEPDAGTVSLQGVSGTAAFVDTSECLHYGSRCRKGERVQLVIRFMPKHRGRFSANPVLNERYATDPLRRMILGYA